MSAAAGIRGVIFHAVEEEHGQLKARLKTAEANLAASVAVRDALQLRLDAAERKLSAIRERIPDTYKILTGEEEDAE